MKPSHLNMQIINAYTTETLIITTMNTKKELAFTTQRRREQVRKNNTHIQSPRERTSKSPIRKSVCSHQQKPRELIRNGLPLRRPAKSGDRPPPGKSILKRCGSRGYSE